MDQEMKRQKPPLVGVEPVMFLYMAAFMTTSVVEEAFFVYKACTVSLGYPSHICHNINNVTFKNYSDQVQIEISIFHQYQNIVAFGIPVLLSFFLGAWSDRVGRKISLLLGLFGSIIYALMIALNSINESWPLEVVLITATLPCAISGGQLTVFMSAFSYLSDTTSQEHRTLRVTLLEVAYLVPMPLGIAFGSYLFRGPFYQSYDKMFFLNAAFLGCAILYTFAFLPWRTNTVGLPEESGPSCSFSHISETLKTLIRPRIENRRTLLIMCLIGMVLYTIQRDEKRMMQIYTLNQFHWGVQEFSSFKTFMSSFYIIGLLVGVPLFKNYFNLKDVYVMMIGAVSHISARIIFILAGNSFWFHVGAVFSIFGPAVAPVFRSITSKLIPTSERGKVFALFSVAETTAPLASGFIFSQVYINTFQTPFPGAIFLVTALSQLIVFFMAIFMNAILKRSNVFQAKEDFEERKTLE